MRRYWWDLAIVLSFVASCGGATERECQFNSNCPAGRYCTPAGMCVADCTPEGGECGAAADCNSFGMCVMRDDAGGLPDAYMAPPPDAFVMRPDVGRDAYEIPDGGPPPEVCTSSDVDGATPVDEDMDGAVDEGCEWYFGVPHPVVMAHLAGGREHRESWFVRGDPSLWLVVQEADGTRRVRIARRASRAEQFTSPTLAPFPAAASPIGFSVTADGLHAILRESAGPSQDFFEYSRADTAAEFSGRTPLDTVNSPVDDNTPHLTEDGLELWFSSVRDPDGQNHIFRSQRAAVGDAFGAPERVTFSTPATADVNPMISRDGHTLFFRRTIAGDDRLFFAYRADTSSLIFDAPVEIPGLGDAGARLTQPFFHEDGQELFFTSSQPWSVITGASSIWRARVCRDHPCAPEVVRCDAGVRSPDGLHCYSRMMSTVTRTMAAANCAAGGGHLATVHSQAERDLLWSRFGTAGARLWLGATDVGLEGTWRWDWPGRVTPEEPFTYATWGAMQPDDSMDEDCIGMWDRAPDVGGQWNDYQCGTTLTQSVCEEELWPTW